MRDSSSSSSSSCIGEKDGRWMPQGKTNLWRVGRRTDDDNNATNKTTRTTRTRGGRRSCRGSSSKHDEGRQFTSFFLVECRECFYHSYVTSVVFLRGGGDLEKARSGLLLYPVLLLGGSLLAPLYLRRLLYYVYTTTNPKNTTRDSASEAFWHRDFPSSFFLQQQPAINKR